MPLQSVHKYNPSRLVKALCQTEIMFPEHDTLEVLNKAAKVPKPHIGFYSHFFALTCIHGEDRRFDPLYPSCRKTSGEVVEARIT